MLLINRIDDRQWEVKTPITVMDSGDDAIQQQCFSPGLFVTSRVTSRTTASSTTPEGEVLSSSPCQDLKRERKG
jgi:hypothetical protein